MSETGLKTEVERFVKWLETTPGRGGRIRSQTTRNVYEYMARVYAKWCEDKGYNSFLDVPPEVTAEFVITYRGSKYVWKERRGHGYVFTRKKTNVTCRTRNMLATVLSQLYTCLTGDDGNEWSKRLRKLVARPEKMSRVETPSDLLTEEEIRAMLKAAEMDPPLVAKRNKAMIAFMYESGCRVGEVLSVRLSDVVATDYGFRVTVKGKTGVRHIPLIDSAKYLTEWLNVHPRKDNPDAPLFVPLQSYKNRTPTDHMIYDVVKKLARRAGIKRKVYPHLLRHTRATHLARVLTEQSLKRVMGWTPSSPMASVYVHLSGRDVEEDLLMARGLKPKVEPISLLEVRKCPFCGFDNDAWAEYCVNCSKPLGARVVAELSEAQEINKRVKAIEKEFREFKRFIMMLLKQGWPTPEAKQLIELYEIFKKAENRMMDMEVLMPDMKT